VRLCGTEQAIRGLAGRFFLIIPSDADFDLGQAIEGPDEKIFNGSLAQKVESIQT
jgi:hypothetical protein